MFLFLQKDEDSSIDLRHVGGGGTGETDEVENNITRSSLSFVPSVDDDGQKITCRAENPWVPNPNRVPVEDSWQVDVVCKTTINLPLFTEIFQFNNSVSFSSFPSLSFLSLFSSLFNNFRKEIPTIWMNVGHSFC